MISSMNGLRSGLGRSDYVLERVVIGQCWRAERAEGSMHARRASKRRARPLNRGVMQHVVEWLRP